jgi:bifunctional pyridoxal-dependent enzyme with beta-cystathionase and maltose regulon repressor activities
VGNSKIISQSKKLGLTELPRYPNVNSYTLILFIQTPKLVGGIPTTLKNMSLSVVMMKFPIYGKIKNVPNHQPEKRTPKPLKKKANPYMDSPLLVYFPFES